MNQSSGTGGQGPHPIPITLVIYRDLRVGMVVLMVMLAAGVIIEKRSATCWQSAISAYYYTSAHSIVIAALLALGTLFIVYKGSTDIRGCLVDSGRGVHVDRRDGAAGSTLAAVRAS